MALGLYLSPLHLDTQQFLGPCPPDPPRLPLCQGRQLRARPTHTQGRLLPAVARLPLMRLQIPGEKDES